MGSFNTNNPGYLTYKHEQLLFSILGGIRLDYLDRLRVTVKIEFKGEAIRHNLDLYNDTQVEKLARKTAERFSIGGSYISSALGALTEELENYRLAENDKQAALEQSTQPLGEADKQAAIAFLKQENLLQRTGEVIGQSGVVGEERNRLLMFLIFTSRKTQRPLHIVSFGSSGTGKSHLQEKVSELIPEEDKIEITSLSGNAFYYFDRDELGHKLILIEDLDGVLAALYPIRELQSKQKISKTVTVKDKRGNARTIHLVVNGPVSIAGCTTQEQLYEDNANRSFLIYLDESKAQDEKVMQYQRLLSAGLIRQEEEQAARRFMQNVQQVLQPVTVRNPYAPFLQIPREVFKPRRTNAHYIAFIEAVTFYHQYQREEKSDPDTGEIYIETTLEDIAEANRLMKHILLRKSDELSGGCRDYLEQLKQYLKAKALKTFTNKAIRSVLRITVSRQKKYMAELQTYGYVHKVRGNKKQGFYYEIADMEEYASLQSQISNVLDGQLQHIREKQPVVQSFAEVPHSKEPLNSNDSKASSKQFGAMEKKTGTAKKSRQQTAAGAGYTWQKLQSSGAESFSPAEVSRITGKSRRTESRYLKSLSERGLLERYREDKGYRYRIIKKETDQSNPHQQ